MSNKIPEDSTLRRHYLTELKYKQLADLPAEQDEFKFNRIYVFLTAFVILAVILI